MKKSYQKDAAKDPWSEALRSAKTRRAVMTGLMEVGLGRVVKWSRVPPTDMETAALTGPEEVR